MRYVDEYRSGEIAAGLVREITKAATRPWVIMEICGGQTHSIVRHGLDRLLPERIELVHGPGCPVCVTPLDIIDQAHAIAARPEVIFTSFGDMLRVPGSHTDLLRLKSEGADVRIVYSPLDALNLARQNPDREVVFFAIGFETTAPANAMAVSQAHAEALANFSVLVSHVTVPPAITALLESPENRVEGFLAPGHVCTVVGVEAYEYLAERFGVPMVITGFEPADILEGILLAVRQLEEGRAEMENQYSRVVAREGNAPAIQLVNKVFEACDRNWRGLGAIPKSGLALRPPYIGFDAASRFNTGFITTREPEQCISGEILRGLKKPLDCPAFGTECTPQVPLGATMVSSEGACAAYFAYGRQTEENSRPSNAAAND